MITVCKISSKLCTRWFKYDRDDLCVNKSQFVPVIFEPPCTNKYHVSIETCSCTAISGFPNSLLQQVKEQSGAQHDACHCYVNIL